jgi:intracellular sulfur oxidation DsrE/DsrF family protein
MAIFAMTVALFAAPAIASDDEIETKKLALQISDNNPGTMTKVLNVATNFARGMSEAGHEYEIEIVAYNAGLHMLREDTSPVAERIKNFPASMPQVTFSACGNTIKGMTKKAGGTPPPIMEFANHVPAGVVRLMELDAQGYFVIRP